MSGERYERLRALFDAAEPLDAAAREAMLARTCSDDPQLRAEVERLLAAKDAVGDFLDAPLATWRGHRIGSFTVEELIAEGGMGVVLRATQEHPRRSVAIKLIRGPGVSSASLHRFEVEAQVLGRLDHPGIARILEAGSVEREGRRIPYLAMELVEGRPLTHYAEHRSLKLRERLELMIAVCEAVHHAHLRGVIHRDLKPANILVREDGQPKVLDFGVARITDADVEFATRHTDVGQILGTLAYMSPEQVRGSREALDLRSDVYALGVVAFELLTGRLPMVLDRAELIEAARRIIEAEPASLSDGSARFPAELETIVQKCLRKEPPARYASASELALDLRRFLRNEPVAARPTSSVYYVQKFVRRHRGLVALGSLTLAVLIAGMLVSLSGWSAADRQRGHALRAMEEATQLSDFLVELIASPDPRQEGRDIRVSELLGRASEAAHIDSVLRPHVARRLHKAIGESYRGLGHDELARQELERALERAEAMGEPDALVDALLDVVNLELELSRLSSAESLLARAERVLAENPSSPRLSLRASLHRGMLAALLERSAEAESVLSAAYTGARAVFGDEDRLTSDIGSELGVAWWRAGRADAARPLFERLVDSDTRRLGADHPATLKTVNNLGVVYRDLGEYELARSMLERGLLAKQRILGTGHPATATGHHNLALVFRHLGEYEAALGHHRTARAIADSIFAPGDRRTPSFRAGEARTLFEMGRDAQARSLYLECFTPLVTLFGEGHTRVLSVAADLAELAERSGDPDEALRWRAWAHRESD